MKLGKLSEVDIRDLWKHEQYDLVAHDELINEIIDKAIIMRDVFKQHI